MISNLQYSPQSAFQGSGGGSATVSATYDFTDTGKDIKSAVITIYDANGATVGTSTVDASSAAGSASGTIHGSAVVSTTVAGNFSFDIQLMDAGGSASNRLKGTFAIASSIQGTRFRNYHPLTAGDVSLPQDLTSYTIAAHCPSGGGGFATFSGSGQSNGTFAINTAPGGYYWLQLGAAFLWTNRATFDFGYDIAGRTSPQWPTMATPVVFNIGNLNPWNSSNDSLLFYNFNTGGHSNPELNLDATVNAPVDGNTSLSGMTMDWYWANYWGPLVDTGQGDHPYLIQMVGTSKGTGTCVTAQRVFEPGNFIQTNGGSTTLTGTFVAIPQTGTLRLAMKATEFSQNPAIIGPSATLTGQSIWFGSLKGAATYGPYANQGDILGWYSSAPSPSDFDLGDVAFGDPYPSTWDRQVYAASTYQNSYLLPGSTIATILSAGISTRTATLPTATAPLRPLVGPVVNPAINGLSLLADQSGVGVNPTLSWQAPALGSPTGYLVSIYRLYVSGSNTHAISAATLYTASTNVQVPPGALLAGNTYVLRIRALQCGKDLQSAPYRLALPYARADILSGMITP